MKNIRNIFSWLMVMPALLMLAGCAIVDDIPFPIVEGTITAFEVEGQCDAAGQGFAGAEIDNDKRTIHIYVSDTVNVARLRITRFEVSNSATIFCDSTTAINPSAFPKEGFAERPSDNAALVDFSKGSSRFVLHTYQDYEWVVTVDQVLNREISMSGQVGEAVIDPINENVIVYVSMSQPLDAIKVEKFSLGGAHGSVSPDPTKEPSYNFSRSRTFSVRYGWSNTPHEWHVFVYQTDAVIGTTADVFPRSVSATISGDMPNDAQPLVEYRVEGAQEWSSVAASDITTATTRYVAEVKGLKPSTTYEYKVTTAASSTSIQKFTTAAAQQLDNASLDDWQVVGSGTQALYQPWKEGGSCYWDTGNRGATTVGASNSTFATEGGRTFANLQSKFIVIKFAAGNIFTGTYLKTDGTNGILGFGRPFSSFPTKMKFDYTYKTSPVNRGGGKWETSYGRYISKDMYDNIKGQPDSCQIYIALIGDKDEEQFDGVTYPYLIRTRPSELHLFNPRSDNVIAYAQLTQGNNVSAWKTETLTLDYRQKNRVPKYIIVVASSSKYGDYFVGGDESLLQLDNLELIYE